MFTANSEHRTSWICTFGAMFLCASISSAQPADSSRLNSLAAGSWSLQFQLGSNFSLQSLDGMFFAKYHLSEHNAFRAGISFSGETASQEVPTSTLQTNKNLNLGIAIQYLHYFYTESDLSLYGGVGPRFFLNHSVYDYSLSSDRQTNWSLGIRVSVGVEWFVKRNISLLAEHAASLNYVRTVLNIASGSFVGERFQITPATVRLGVSLYI